MTTNEVIEQIYLYTKKNSTGYFSPEEIMTAINNGQYSLYGFYLGFPELYQGNGQAPVQFARTQRIDDALRPFVRTVQINLTNGIGTFPSDYAYLDATSVRYYVNPEDCAPGDNDVMAYRPIDVLFDNEWASRVTSLIDKPTVKRPVLRQISKTQLEVSPRSIKRIEFDYLRNPAPFVWDYTTSNGRPVWNPASPLNQELEWYEIDQRKVIVRALQTLGVNMADQSLIQFSELKQREGV